MSKGPILLFQTKDRKAIREERMAANNYFLVRSEGNTFSTLGQYILYKRGEGIGDRGFMAKIAAARDPKDLNIRVIQAGRHKTPRNWGK